MKDPADVLILARQAHAAHDWATAAAHFDAAGVERLTADDLAAHADALWWLGRVEDNLRLTAHAYEAFLACSRPADAAWVATLLGIFHMGRGDQPQAIDWIGRASRLLEGIPECPASDAEAERKPGVSTTCGHRWQRPKTASDPGKRCSRAGGSRWSETGSA